MLHFLPHHQLQQLIDLLHQEGYECYGPQVKSGAIIYEQLKHADELPWGMRDLQKPGEYRLEKTDAQTAFGFSNGPTGLKALLFKPRETIWKVQRDEQGHLSFQPHYAEEKPIAFFGARSCDVEAVAIQDKVFIESNYQSAHYLERRKKLLMIAVQCAQSSENCFCVSAGCGPKVNKTTDLLLTEIEEGFVIQSGTNAGEKVLTQLKLKIAEEQQIENANRKVKQAADMQTKKILYDNKRELRDLLFSNLDHPRWNEVAERCLSCGNCTSVCPTCFCHDKVENPSLDGLSSEQVQEWDSCFTEGHSIMHGVAIRDDIKKRYRQWLTHKVGSWFDQFDTSGCVGCGRCISWCPVGIDLTEELAALK